MSPHITILIEKFQSLPMKIHRLGDDRKFGRKFGSALFFVSNFSTYCLSERSAEPKVRSITNYYGDFVLDLRCLEMVQILDLHGFWSKSQYIRTSRGFSQETKNTYKWRTKCTSRTDQWKSKLKMFLFLKLNRA